MGHKERIVKPEPFLEIDLIGNCDRVAVPLDTWYLEKLIINGTTIYTPQDYTVISQFWDSEGFSYEGCSNFYGLVTHTGNQNFSIVNGSIGDQICNGPIDEYDLLYIDNFLQWDM